jgi:hypothetical protein
VAALVLTGAILKRRVENELARVRDQAAVNYVKAGKFPLHPEEAKTNALENPPPPRRIGESFAEAFRKAVGEAEYYEAMRSKLETLMGGQNCWRLSTAPSTSTRQRMSAVQQLLKLNWRGSEIITCKSCCVTFLSGQPQTCLSSKALKEILTGLRWVALYLSLPFRIALGFGFGIALGAWLIKKAGLDRTWR